MYKAGPNATLTPCTVPASHIGQVDDERDGLVFLEEDLSSVELWTRAEDVRRFELERALRQLGPTAERVRQPLAELSRRLVREVLRQPIARLCEGGVEETTARRLFGLDAGEEDAELSGDVFPGSGAAHPLQEEET